MTLGPLPNAPPRVRGRGDQTRSISAPAVVAVLLLTAAVAAAHPGPAAHGFASGVEHPITGLDHLLAMLAVGVIAANLRRGWLWALPAAFVLAMVAGAAAGAAGVFVPSWWAETGIAASVVVFGGMVALGARVPAGVVVPLTILFAVCHGSAHAAEMPAGGGVAAFFAGFVIATALLHAVGVGLGTSLARASQRVVLRGCGVAIGVCGVMMLAGFL